MLTEPGAQILAIAEDQLHREILREAAHVVVDEIGDDQRRRELEGGGARRR